MENNEVLTLVLFVLVALGLMFLVGWILIVTDRIEQLQKELKKMDEIKNALDQLKKEIEAR